MCGSIPCRCSDVCVFPGPQKCVIDRSHVLRSKARSKLEPLVQKKYCLLTRFGSPSLAINLYVGNACMPFSAGASACVSFNQFILAPIKVSIHGFSCSPNPSAEPLTQTPCAASRSQVFNPLAQTICESAIDASARSASAFAIHSGASGIVAGIDSRVNQSESDGFKGHITSRETFGGRERDGNKRR